MVMRRSAVRVCSPARERARKSKVSGFFSCSGYFAFPSVFALLGTIWGLPHISECSPFRRAGPGPFEGLGAGSLHPGGIPPAVQVRPDPVQPLRLPKLPEALVHQAPGFLPRDPKPLPNQLIFEPVPVLADDRPSPACLQGVHSAPCPA